MWAAINAAARQIYQAVIKESKGGLDQVGHGVSPAPDQESYELPADCQQLVRVRERVSSYDDWRIVHSADWLGVISE